MDENRSFANISQHVVSPYLRCLVNPDQEGSRSAGGTDGSEWALYGFFRSLYEAMFNAPERFGLPVKDDVIIDDQEQNPVAKRQVVKRESRRPREIVAEALDLLYLIGLKGSLNGDALWLDGGSYHEFLQQGLKNKNRLLKGLGEIGLAVRTEDGAASITAPSILR